MGVAKRKLMNRPTSHGLLWFLSLFTVAGASIGCATPGPIVTLAPANNAVVWVAGRASVSQEKTGVRVATAFEHQDGDTLGLRVEIENATEAPIELDPRNISFNFCESQHRETCAPAERAINPESVLTQLAQARSRNEADSVNDQALLGTLALLSLATDVVAIGSGNADRHTGQLTHALANDMAVDEIRHDSRRASFSSPAAALVRRRLAPQHDRPGARRRWARLHPHLSQGAPDLAARPARWPDLLVPLRADSDHRPCHATVLSLTDKPAGKGGASTSRYFSVKTRRTAHAAP